MSAERKPVNVLEVMDALEWGHNLRRCAICAGWDGKGNGETDHRHTDECPLREARAAVAGMIDELTKRRAKDALVAELIEASIRVDALSIQSAAHKALRAALAALRGKDGA